MFLMKGLKTPGTSMLLSRRCRQFSVSVFGILSREHGKNVNRRCILLQDRDPVRVDIEAGYCSYSAFKIMKLESPRFQSVITEDVRKLQRLFNENGYEIRIAGGAVRDLLLGNVPSDLDFATTATPDEMKELFTKHNIRILNLRGESHGTITPRINEKNFEITTLRTDKVTDGRHALVEFTKDWYLDASRRDLTMNSMFLDFDGNVYDYFNGYDDLLNKRVVFVGDASMRIQEDYLRILRYFRFFGRTSRDADSHDEATLTAIRNNAKGLGKISGERVWAEIKKILTGNHGVELLKKMIDLDLGPEIGLPPEPNVAELDKICERAKTNGVALEPMTILSALLQNESDVTNLHARLKLSAFERDLAHFIVEFRCPENSPTTLGGYQRLILHNKSLTNRLSYVAELLKYKGEIDILRDFEKWNVPKFPLSGRKIIEKGIVDGPQVAFILYEIKEAWIESNYTMTGEELENLIVTTAEKYDASNVSSIPKTKKKRFS